MIRPVLHLLTEIAGFSILVMLVLTLIAALIVSRRERRWVIPDLDILGWLICVGVVSLAIALLTAT